MCPSNTSSTGQRGRLPIPVEIVLQFPYPRQLVLDTYHKLLSTALPSRSVPASAATSVAAAGGAETDNSKERVTARMLLLAVEAQINPHFSPQHDDGAASLANDSSSYASFTAPRRVVSGDESPGHDPAFSRSGGDLPPQPPRTATGVGGVGGDLEDDAPTWKNSPSPTAAAGDGPLTTSTTARTATTTLLPPATTPTPATPAPLPKVASLPHSEKSSTSSASSVDTTQCSVAVSGTVQTSPPIATEEPLPSVGTGASAHVTFTMPSADADHSAVDNDTEEARRHQQRRLLALKKENQRLKNRRLCRKCRKNPVDLTLLPCGHFCFCQACGASFISCPVCCKTILADVKTYIS